MARIAMVVGQEFEDSEAMVPLERLRKAGHQVEILGSRAGEEVRGKKGDARLRVDAACGERDPRDYDALVIPGGHSPDHLRTDEKVVGFVRGFAQTGRLTGVICHGPQLLIEAGAVDGRRLTSWRSVRTDLLNAGAEWVDEEVVVDGNLVTSRMPQDLDAFTAALLERLPH
jgi:protease I